jgi:hypothetical protein
MKMKNSKPFFLDKILIEIGFTSIYKSLSAHRDSCGGIGRNRKSRVEWWAMLVIETEVLATRV